MNKLICTNHEEVHKSEVESPPATERVNYIELSHKVVQLCQSLKRTTVEMQS